MVRGTTQRRTREVALVVPRVRAAPADLGTRTLGGVALRAASARIAAFSASHSLHTRLPRAFAGPSVKAAISSNVVRPHSQHVEQSQ